MSSRFLTRVLLCLFLLPAAGFAADEISPAVSQMPPLTLSECVALARKRSEDIAIRQEAINEAEGRFLQAFSGVLPRASFVDSEKRQNGSGGSAFTLRYIPERKFAFSQPLFSGFKEFAAMAASRAERRQRIQEKARAEQLLFADVADAFYLLLQEQEDLTALEAIRAALRERITELKARERLGRSRPGEVASAEAQLRRLEAEWERVNSLKVTSEQLLAFLTGLDHVEGLADSQTPTPPLETQDVYLAKADARPDVRAAEEARYVAQKQVALAKGGFFPTVSVESNYYAQRVGVSRGIDWDVLLKADVPIFQGSQVFGEVKQASARAREAALQLEKAQRQAVLDIRDLYAQFQAGLARRAALEKALAAAEENYRLQVADYTFNLVSNLDVLKALQDLQDVRRDVISASYDVKRLYWHLRAAIGETL